MSKDSAWGMRRSAWSRRSAATFRGSGAGRSSSCRSSTRTALACSARKGCSRPASIAAFSAMAASSMERRPRLRIPMADGTLYPLNVPEDDELMPSLLTLSDVLGTGHHAAIVSRVGPGGVVAVVGDGAVGLCGVIAAKRLGAEQIIIMGRHEQRIALAREFGATDVVSERGEEAVARVRDLTGGLGVQSVLECVGTEQAMDTSMGIVRAGGGVGRVGVPHYEAIKGAQQMFYDNVIVGGGPAPTRAYIEELLPDVIEGRIEPGRVFDRTVDLDGVPDGYRAMNEREALKVLIRP